MKARTIKAIIRKKINEWLASIEDEKLREDLKDKIIVTGGCIASMLLGEDINDFDIYLADKGIVSRVAHYYVDKFREGRELKIYVEDEEDRVKIKVQSAGIASEEKDKDNGYQFFENRSPSEAEEYVEGVASVLKDSEDDPAKKPYRPVFLSTNAITLANKIQIVIRFYGDAEEIHKNYDFVHCTNYWDSKSGQLTLHPKALEALLTKELVYVGSRYPLASLIRTRKFIKRGFTCNAGQFLKMCYQVNELDLGNIEVLEDQLTGVDMAYFMVLIDALKAKREKDPTWKYGYEYIVAVVDKIF